MFLLKLISNMSLTLSESKVIEIKNNDFKDIENNKFTVVDFWAPWCGPCRMLTPILDSLAEKFLSNVSFAKVNIDENQDLAQTFEVQTLPTIMFFKEGKLVHKMVGLPNEEAFSDMIREKFKIN